MIEMKPNGIYFFQSTEIVFWPTLRSYLLSFLCVCCKEKYEFNLRDLIPLVCDRNRHNAGTRRMEGPSVPFKGINAEVLGHVCYYHY